MTIINIPNTPSACIIVTLTSVNTNISSTNKSIFKIDRTRTFRECIYDSHSVKKDIGLHLLDCTYWVAPTGFLNDK